MLREEEGKLRQQIGDMLAKGLKTQTEPFPETHVEFAKLLDELRTLDPEDMEGKLVLPKFSVIFNLADSKLVRLPDK